MKNAVRGNWAKLIGGGLPASALLRRGKPTRRYDQAEDAVRVIPATFVTGLVRVCDGFVTLFFRTLVPGASRW